MNLLFSINKNCVRLLLNCASSIAAKGGAETYRAYILHSDLTQAHQQEILSNMPTAFQCTFIPVPEVLFEGFPETKRYPKQIYYRLAAAKLLPEQVERVLYLDVDTLVINSLTELYHTDFDGNLFVACTHAGDFLSFVNRLRLDVDETVPYINTGVMLMNLPLMRQQVQLRDIQQYALANRALLILPDQDILTALYGHQVKLVDAMKYNLSDRDIDFHNLHPTREKITLDWVRQNAAIVHYYGRNKPWKPYYRGMLNTLYQEHQSSQGRACV